MTSSINQTELYESANIIVQTINEEICRLHQTTGKIEPHKIFLGGIS